RQAPHAAALAVVVVDRVVLRAAVVPDRERARHPAHAAGELVPGLVRLEEVDDRPALLLAHVAKAHGVAAAAVERLLARLGVRARDRMLGLVFLGPFDAADLHAADLVLGVNLRAAPAVL